MQLRQLLAILEKIQPPGLHAFHTDLLYRWVIYCRSRPISVTAKTAIVFAPHPDDETLGCGGLIALKREQGTPVSVVFLTDGRNAHADPLAADAVATARRQEALAALAVLGVAPQAVHFLDAPDGTLGDLSEETEAGVVAHLCGLLQSLRPEEAYLPHRKDRHRDHEAAFCLIQDAISQTGVTMDVFEYPIWLFWRMPLLFGLGWKRQEIAGAVKISIETVRAKKAAALAAHRSQLAEAILPAGFLRRFFQPHELFFQREPSRERRTPG